MMAFQAYQAWQRSQASRRRNRSRNRQPAGRARDRGTQPRHAGAIAAAKADGEIDTREQQMISSEIGKHTDDPQLQQWLEAEVAKPLDANEVARPPTATRPWPPKCTWSA
jgi:uncharacterized membrane protein YebE (DUF533 family)